MERLLLYFFNYQKGRVIALDSGFGVVLEALALLTVGLYCSMVLKKKRYWPSNSKGDEVMLYMNDKPFGTIAVRQGELNGKTFFVEAIKDSKHTSFMLHTYGTTQAGVRYGGRNVDGTRTSIRYTRRCEVYYEARHCIDNNNNVRQGSSSLEESWATKSWEMRQFSFILALCEANALVAFNYFVRKPAGLSMLSLKEFRRILIKEIFTRYLAALATKEDICSIETSPPRKRTRSQHQHQLQKNPDFAGIFRHGRWTTAKDKYQKEKCSCSSYKKRVRTYSSCDKTSIFLP